MIFSLYSRVKVRLGDEEHVYDASRMMYSEVAEVERITGWSFGEWQQELARYSIKAVAALLHVLRRRDEMPSDFATLEFNSALLDVIPLHDDGSEFTAQEVADDLARRMKEIADAKAVPTGAAGGSAAAENPKAMTTTSLSSPSDSTSGPGSSTNGSAGPTSRSARHTSTRS